VEGEDDDVIIETDSEKEGEEEEQTDKGRKQLVRGQRRLSDILS